jgi:uroporphyrinogen decarboxylase
MYDTQMQVNKRFYDLLDFTVNVDTTDIYFDREAFVRDHPDMPQNRFLAKNLDNFERYYTTKPFEQIPGVKKLFEGIDYFNKRLPKEKYVCHYFGVQGALDYFSTFRGSGQFMMDLFDSPDKVHRIFSYMTERSLQWLEFAQKNWGALNRDSILFDKLDIGEDYCAYMTPELFDEFVLPYTGKLVEQYKNKVLCSLHTDGDVIPSGIGKLGELGIDELMGFSPNIDIKEFRKALPDVILGGNIHPIKVMIEGTPDDVKSAARYCFENAAQNGKFVLCTGGAIAANAKPENVDAFIEATYKIVKY